MRASRAGSGILARNGESSDDELDFVVSDTPWPHLRAEIADARLLQPHPARVRGEKHHERVTVGVLRALLQQCKARVYARSRVWPTVSTSPPQLRGSGRLAAVQGRKVFLNQ